MLGSLGVNVAYCSLFRGRPGRYVPLDASKGRLVCLIGQEAPHVQDRERPGGLGSTARGRRQR
ncbi:hypothetical protein GCM10022204_17230 [Microlunatus aurantiacus]|uniref:Uncharacterized protein n=1 Tax=Microlunatus aurantiacus TaxID=446786 RepID=A0ABP7D5N1_9ACTN